MQQCVLVEAGNAQPRSLANAFQKAVTGHGDGILANSYKALASFLGRYGRPCTKTPMSESWQPVGSQRRPAQAFPEFHPLNHLLRSSEWTGTLINAKCIIEGILLTLQAPMMSYWRPDD